MNEQVNIGGINVASFKSMEELITTSIIVNDTVVPGSAIAINPEKVMAARHSTCVKEVIEQATLRYPDGVGVSYVMEKKLGKKIARIPGCELWEQVMMQSIKAKLSVFLVGASEEVIVATRNKLTDKGVNIVGYENGYFDTGEEEQLIAQIAASGANIITVALGSPRQELFIFKCRKQMPYAFFMGVGGTYDVYTGNVKRAPKVFQKLNLEWLFRLLSQPTRITRQTNLIKYILLYFKGKL